MENKEHKHVDNPIQALVRLVLHDIIAEVEQKYGMSICEYVKMCKGGAYEQTD